MRRLAGGLCISAALLLSVAPAISENGRDAYLDRDASMSLIGQDLYVKIGKVVRGETEYSEATVAAAEDLVKLVADLPTLFAPDSAIPESHLKPELFANKARADHMIAAVQNASQSLLAVVKSGDKNKIVAAYQNLSDACNSCHKEFRTPYD